jgi:rhodanese-related sulfurtransferase
VWPFSQGGRDHAGNGSGAAIKSIDPTQAYARQKEGAKLVDVRSEVEFRGSHPRGARHVSPRSIKRDETGLSRDDEVVVICLSGHRSPRAARRLTDLGFSDVSHVKGGLLAWRKAGLPLAK